MRALHLLTLVALVLACQARRGGGKKHHKFGGKDLKPLHRVCQLNQFCDEGQFGPWIFEKGENTCADFQGANKKDDIWQDVKKSEGPQNCTQGTLNICALCFDQESFQITQASESKQKSNVKLTGDLGNLAEKILMKKLMMGVELGWGQVLSA